MQVRPFLNFSLPPKISPKFIPYLDQNIHINRLLDNLSEILKWDSPQAFDLDLEPRLSADRTTQYEAADVSSFHRKSKRTFF